MIKSAIQGVSDKALNVFGRQLKKKVANQYINGKYITEIVVVQDSGFTKLILAYYDTNQYDCINTRVITENNLRDLSEYYVDFSGGMPHWNITVMDNVNNIIYNCKDYPNLIPSNIKNLIAKYAKHATELEYAKIYSVYPENTLLKDMHAVNNFNCDNNLLSKADNQIVGLKLEFPDSRSCGVDIALHVFSRKDSKLVLGVYVDEEVDEYLSNNLLIAEDALIQIQDEFSNVIQSTNGLTGLKTISDENPSLEIEKIVFKK